MYMYIVYTHLSTYPTNVCECVQTHVYHMYICMHVYVGVCGATCMHECAHAYVHKCTRVPYMCVLCACTGVCACMPLHMVSTTSYTGMYACIGEFHKYVLCVHVCALCVYLCGWVRVHTVCACTCAPSCAEIRAFILCVCIIVHVCTCMRPFYPAHLSLRDKISVPF
jgi:hypothetical protein